MSLSEKLFLVFCDVDDFCQIFLPLWQVSLLQTGHIKRVREPRLSISEIMSLIIHFHQSHYRDFKSYYQEYVQVHLRGEFPNLVSYNRFVELMPRVLVPLCAYLDERKGQVSGISFIDTTKIAVCHPKRIKRHKVFQDIAQLGKGVCQIGRSK